MTSDDRITSDVIHDVLDALERHGYTRSGDLHAGRAIELIGDLARICEGTQDPRPSGCVAGLSSQPAAPQSPGRPGQDAVIVPAGQVKTLLAALDDAAEYKRDRAETCANCSDQSCTTCQWRLQAAEAYDQMADRLIHAAEASAAQQRARTHTAPPSTGPHAAADKEAGQ